MLGFVGFQLWGTGIAESRAQSELAQQLDAPQATSSTPNFGDAVGRISIPSIKVDKYLVAGVKWKALQKGPGLFPNSPLPGQYGNVAIAGHRTTFGAPFERINELSKGDLVEITTADGDFTYEVTGPPRVVSPDAVEEVATNDTTRAMLTLVSCHPKWTASKRIIVNAELQDTITPLTATPLVLKTDGKAAFKEGWFHDPSAWPAVIIFGLILAGIARAAVVAARGRTDKTQVYARATVMFVIVLYPFYENLARLLPTNL